MFLEKFWSKAEVNGPDQCWPWTKATNKAGYGQITVNRRMQGAHRVAWQIANRVDLPSDVHILHSCDNPPCVNPAHLRPGDHQANMTDRHERGRYAVKTHCVRGHEFTPENTYWNEKAQQRYCRSCLRINSRETQRRKRARLKAEAKAA